MARIYLKYNSYSHEVTDAAVSISRRAEFTDAGACYAIRETWFIRGRLIADTQSELSTAIRNLQHYYKLQHYNIELLFDGVTNNQTAHRMQALDTIDGIRVTAQPSYPIGEGAQYTTFRDYTIIVEGLVKTGAAGSDLVLWEQRITSDGGQPRNVVIETLDTLPVIQQTAYHTAVSVMQEGRAIGLKGWPRAADHLFSGSEVAVYRNEVSEQSPQTTFIRARRLDYMYEVTWNYVFGLPKRYTISAENNKRPKSAQLTD